MALSTLTSTVLLLLFNFVLFCAGTFLNSVVVISIWKSAQLRNKLCYFTIFLLSCSDLAAVVVIHPSIAWIIYSILRAEKYKVYEIIYFIIFLVQSTSIIILLTLNVERFLAIQFPFLHQEHVTKKRLMGFTATLECLLLLLVLASFS